MNPPGQPQNLHLTNRLGCFSKKQERGSLSFLSCLYLVITRDSEAANIFPGSTLHYGKHKHVLVCSHPHAGRSALSPFPPLSPSANQGSGRRGDFQVLWGPRNRDSWSHRSWKKCLSWVVTLEIHPRFSLVCANEFCLLMSSTLKQMPVLSTCCRRALRITGRKSQVVHVGNILSDDAQGFIRASGRRAQASLWHQGSSWRR